MTTGGPEYKDTKQIPKVSEIEILVANAKNELKGEIKSGFAEFAAVQDVNHKLVMNEIENIKSKVDHLERWKGDSEKKFLDSDRKLNDHSIRAKQPSVTDIRLEAELTNTKLELEKEVKAREALALETKQQTDMLRTLTRNSSKILKFLNSPQVRTILIIISVIGGNIIVWMKK